MNATSQATAVVLAAGKGTRMRSARPKVLHEVAGWPMLTHVLRSAVSAGCRRAIVIVGHGSGDVKGAAKSFAPKDLQLDWALQAEQLGTGHAVQQIRDLVTDDERLLILSGDAPLIAAASLRKLLEAPVGALAAARVADPGSLGRVFRRPDGSLQAIVEAADANSEQLQVDLVNAGFYALPAGPLLHQLANLDADNSQGEIYLTDAVVALAADDRIEVVVLDDSSEAWGINDRADLAKVDRRWMERHLDELMAAGVTIYDPASVRVEAGVEIGADTVLHSGVVLRGSSRIGSGCEVDVGCVVQDSELHDGAMLGAYTWAEGATLHESAHAGPFARLRPGAVLGPGAKVGNFVEIKNSNLAAGVKAGHLAYLGDAEIGENANIGAGTITCNYDGVKKSKTVIGEGAFIGSDSMLVAPVTVGDRATTGAGSVITSDVPDDALAVERSQQRNIKNWTGRKSRGRKAKQRNQEKKD